MAQARSPCRVRKSCVHRDRPGSAFASTSFIPMSDFTARLMTDLSTAATEATRKGEAPGCEPAVAMTRHSVGVRSTVGRKVRAAARSIFAARMHGRTEIESPNSPGRSACARNSPVIRAVPSTLADPSIRLTARAADCLVLMLKHRTHILQGMAGCPLERGAKRQQNFNSKTLNNIKIISEKPSPNRARYAPMPWPDGACPVSSDCPS